VDIWHEYLMTVLSHVWLPGLLDSLVPFAFLVSELLMVHFVGENLRGWLLGYGLVGVAAWAQRNLGIRQFADEERDVPLALAARHWYRGALAVAVTAFGLLGWLLYDALGLESAQLAVAVAGLAGVVVIIASSVPMWNEILRYARGEPVGTDRSGRVSRTDRSR
jgi:predicted MFS family arabinose efflux permease